MESFLISLLHHAGSRPNAPALIDFGQSPETTVTWRQLASEVYRAHQTLEQIATRQGHSDLRGMPVGYAASNTVPQLLLGLACQMSGAIEVPLDVRGGESYVKKCWQQVIGLWIDDGVWQDVWCACADSNLNDYINKIRDAAESLDLDSPSLILFTSGTTGDPKGVTLSHRNLIGNANAKLTAVPQHCDDVRVSILSYAHAYARTCDLGTWLLSGSVLVPAWGYQDWVRIAPQIRPTIVNTVPSIAERIREETGASTTRLRLLGCGGAAMSQDDFHAWKQRGVTVIQGYGLTETAPVICSATPENARAGWVGRLVDGWEHKIVAGELRVRGPHTMLGYWNDPVSTALRVDAQGWLKTGDVVEQDPDSGQFRILGRADDLLILPNGHALHPVALEGLLTEEPSIRHAFVTCVGIRIVVWLDVVGEWHDEQARQIIHSRLASRPRWEIPKEIKRFPEPIESRMELLTPKGSLRRKAVQRWVESL
ncbi:class I adenylate-forming enzyme family protein [Stieleria varia]|uniref:Long-chain-fatty-acid--CoA ligase n=1 Tax=Stieleria varia TaxID=2528005 RepID=A0A5C6B0P8_9BACT|nr:AMP-binding protein [Stieleria varia]TWU05029.1 Long-chain-fatty-acid--CoA ligase [Stieleria varia]